VPHISTSQSSPCPTLRSPMHALQRNLQYADLNPALVVVVEEVVEEEEEEEERTGCRCNQTH